MNDTWTYGFQGLMTHFTDLDIEQSDWMVKEIKKERGGISFMTPKADGEIYLSWKDIYVADIKFIGGQEYKNEMTIGELRFILNKIEWMRTEFIKGAAAALIAAFPSDEESDGTKF
jgi:hypothetical protein|tara:strand:+ start:44 stop:391 length:348 start_codon:yes stop_codon:yes gene_type:complete